MAAFEKNRQDLPYRSTGASISDDDAVPDTDPSDTSSLLLERLQAYKHACGYLENYISATEKVERAHAKEYEKVLKTVSDPLKEGHHFDQNLGGMAGLFENIRSNTQGIANSHLETEKNLKGSVLPILERLHQEIKNKSKELTKGAVKGSKDVDKARNTTQKHIELLGQHTAAFASSGGKVEPANDPYILQRGVNHRLNKQVLEENNNRHDLLAVQDSFQQFEGHVIQTIQQAMSTFTQYVGGQSERQRAMYSDIVSTTQRIPLDFEWKGFLHRNSGTLIDPSAPTRSVSNISFPNQNHASTMPLIAGTLERKSRAALKGYNTGYYVITPSKYLHQFKDDDDIRTEPIPELSLYLPDCTIGGVNGEKFNVKGKDTSKGKVGSSLAMSHEFSFKAHTAADAEKWHNVIREAAGGAMHTSSTPASPTDSRNVSGQQAPPQYEDAKQPAPLQTQTGYQGSPITPGEGTVPGSAGGVGQQHVVSPTTSRNYNFGRDSAISNKRHVPQLSISDDNHHVTEAIGDMYGDHQYGKRDSRPLSFITSSSPGHTSPITSARSPHTSRVGSSPPRSPRAYSPRHPLPRTGSNEPLPQHVNGQGVNMASRSNSGGSEGGKLSPSNSLRDQSNSDTANAHFPLNDIDYESNPNAVVQELNNLAALRRMSMDVNASGDPDLPSFPNNFGIPSAPPVGTDPDDRARLYWVPASVHPELAPMEFKTFLDKKVRSLKRRSEEKNSLSLDGLQREDSGGGLRRKKSMLSRQIDNTSGRGGEGYTDGAERLDRKRSQSGTETLNSGISNLQDLEVLVNEPERIMQRFSLDSGVEGAEANSGDDVPILPSIPSGSNSLRRSTRTTYRRGGSIRKGERVPYSKRTSHTIETDGNEPRSSSPIMPTGEPSNLSRMQNEPMAPSERVAENFSRPGRLNRPPAMPPRGSQPMRYEEAPDRRSEEYRDPPSTSPQPRHFVSQIASNGRLGVTPQALGKTVPSIVETPPQSEEIRYMSKQGHIPERSSSHEPPPSMPPSAPVPTGSSSSRPHKWSPQSRTNQSVPPNQTLNEMTSHPSPLPGNNTRTDSLSFIPTLTEDKKADSKKLKDKKEADGDGGRKSSWSWGSLLGSEEKERRKREEEEAKEAKKAKIRLGKQVDRSHDNTRLDLLQTTMEGSRGRESVVLDRGDIKLEEERKKESSRKSSSTETKKDKDPGFFSSLLGGAKRKADRDSTGKKYNSRNLSPEPPVKILKPDIDYNWTRFSIIEERAIYRMAHIKLANPKRALYSQVLLSNFMYSYLAKVQQMHPQANLPQSAAQRQQAAQQKKDQPEEFSQYQKYQEQQQRQQQQEEERAAAQEQDQVPVQAQAQAQAQAPTLSPIQQHDSSGSFMDMDYDYDRPENEYNRHRPQSRASQHSSHSMESSGNGHPSYGVGNHHRRTQQQTSYNSQQQTSPYAYQQGQFDEPGRADDDDMW